jgi:hypothetical protein
MIITKFLEPSIGENLCELMLEKVSTEFQDGY